MGMYEMFVRPAGRDGNAGGRLMAQEGTSMAREVVALLGSLPPRGRVLEVGFGPGVGIATLLKVHPEVQVYGVDHSALMHEHAAARNADAIEAGRVVLLLGSAGHLPVEDSSCDAAMVVDNLHFWPDPHAGLRELHRALRPGAKVVCAFTPPSGGPPSSLVEMFAQTGFEEIDERQTTAGYLLHAVRP